MGVWAEERWAAGGDLREAARRVGITGAWALGLAMVAVSAYQYATAGGFGMDAHAYWLAGRSTHPYGPRPGANDAYLYSPLFAQLVRPVAALPWPAFRLIWLAVETVAYSWLLWPLKLRWRALAGLYCVPALFIGNIYGVLGVGLVLAMRGRTETWAYPLLTKLSPAGVGFVWHAARGEWRQLARAAAAVVLLVGVSVAAEPHMWAEWLSFLADHSGDGVWRFVQIPVALIVAGYASRKNRPWLLVVAWWLSMPTATPLFMQAWGALAPMARIAVRPSPSAPVDGRRPAMVGPQARTM